MSGHPAMAGCQPKAWPEPGRRSQERKLTRERLGGEPESRQTKSSGARARSLETHVHLRGPLRCRASIVSPRLSLGHDDDQRSSDKTKVPDAEPRGNPGATAPHPQPHGDKPHDNKPAAATRPAHTPAPSRRPIHAARRGRVRAVYPGRGTRSGSTCLGGTNQASPDTPPPRMSMPQPSS